VVRLEVPDAIINRQEVIQLAEIYYDSFISLEVIDFENSSGGILLFPSEPVES
jgi:hypothetical protein